MARGVFLHRADSIYQDDPESRYQFPRQYLKAASQCVGDWIIYLEPTKAGKSGYYAVAKVEAVTPDPSTPGMYIALIEPGSYLPLERNVGFNIAGDYPERSVLNDAGRVSGRAQSAMRIIPDDDFNRILTLGIPDDDLILPRQTLDDGIGLPNILLEERQPFIFEVERDRSPMLTNRLVRDRVFRSRVLDAYDNRCALTGACFINGGGRAETEAAHIRPVSEGGPDMVPNGLALSGTVHWMFDRGLLSLADDGSILISRAVNDRDSLDRLLLPDRRALRPRYPQAYPHQRFLAWHRENRFKV
jgi:putative restriction endonuclease